MVDFKLAIKKEGLTDEQILLIKRYKDFLMPTGSYAEEYTAGFKLYIGDEVSKDNISAFFVSYGIYTIDAAFFNEEWSY